MSNVMSRKTFVATAATGAIAVSAVASGMGRQAFAEEAAKASEETVDWLGEPPAIDEASVVETVDVDVLVCGAGQSGTPCAYFAATGGAKTLWIDRSSIPVHMRQSAFGAVDSSYQKELGVEINHEDILNDIARYANDQCSMALWRNWVECSGEAADWYGSMVEKAGHRIVLEYAMPPAGRYQTWPTGHGTATMDDMPDNPYDKSPCEGDETAVWETIEADFEAAGGEFRASTALVELIVENGRVIGAYATNADGNYIRINAAKGVVVATGGYMSNGDMFRALQGGLEKSIVVGCKWGTSHGDGIKACLWAGAHKDPFPTTMLFDRCNVKPDYELGKVFDGKPDFNYFHFSSQPFLKVDCTGKRLCNESAPYDYVVHAARQTPNRAWYPIWDSSWQEDVLQFQTIGCSTAYTREGSNHHAIGLNGIQAQIDQYVEGGYVIKADTLEELAEGLGFDKAVFLAEVEKYNGWVEQGYDGEFGKDPYRLSALDEPPYYGMKVGAMGLCTLDGIVVNVSYQPLDENGSPIEGLYAIGVDSGCAYAHTYPNFGAGTNAGRCATAGMLVGKALASK